jgi:hypothetical protein
MRTPKHSRTATWLAAAALAVAGCAGASGHGAGGPATTGRTGGSAPQGSTVAQVTAVWQQYVQCAHIHGAPSFPMPRIDDQGHASFTTNVKSQSLAVAGACGHILRSLPASSQNGPPTAPMSTLLAFARCLRAHGLTDWPDPNSQGAFPLPQRLISLGKAEIERQGAACRSIYDGPIIGASSQGAAGG